MKMRKLAPNMPLFANSKEFKDLERRREIGHEAKQEGSADEAAASVIPGNARQMRMIAIELIDPNPLAPREVYTPQMILERAEALRTQGQHDPIHVIPNPDEPGRFIICDGWTRVQACRDHQVMHELLAEVHEGMTLHQSAWFGYQQNEERDQHCDLDRAMFYEKLIAAGETAAEVARQAGVSRAQMQNFRAFTKLPSEVLDVVRTNPVRFGANAAYQLYRLSERAGLRQALRVASRFVEEQRSFSWLLNQVQLCIEPKAPRVSQSSKVIRYSNGYFKLREGNAEVRIGLVADDEASFSAEMEKLLDKYARKVVDHPTDGADDEHGRANDVD
jgi:ParB family chromosome partitioning protein